MRRVVVVAALLVPISVAADFRTLNFGAPCTKVRSQELAGGAKDFAWPVQGIGIFAFEGKALGRNLVITYFCPKGVLLTGNYYLPVELLSKAAASYRAVHKQLTQSYGAPWLDNAPWASSSLTGPRPETDPQRFMTTWKTEKSRVTASILPTTEGEPKGWRVAVVFSQVLGEERSN